MHPDTIGNLNGDKQPRLIIFNGTEEILGKLQAQGFCLFVIQQLYDNESILSPATTLQGTVTLF